VVAAPTDDRVDAELLLRLQRERERLLALQGQGAIPAPRSLSLDGRVADGYELIVFAPQRPLRFAVTVRFEGKSVAERWRAVLREAFAYFDRDHNGFLDGTEVQNIFTDAALAQTMANGFYSPNPADLPTLARLDTDKDLRVSFDEFTAYYRQTAGAVMRAYPAQPEAGVNAQATEALFKLFDRNGDGKLTKEEVDGAEKLIATQDADEDECLSLAELVPNAFDGRNGRVVATPVAVNRPAQSVPQNILLFDLGRAPGTVTQRLIKQYDRDGDFELTKQEAGFDDETFRRLDTDGDGKLSGEELDAWRTGSPDLAVTLSLAPKAVDCVAEVTTDPKVVAARGFTISRLETGRLIVRLDRQSIEFWAYGAVLQQFRQQTAKQQLSGLFQAAAGTKGYVLEKDLNGPAAPNFQLIRVMFEPADVNGDGKLTKEEFDRYLDLQQSFADVGLGLTPAVQTPTLFQLLDENRDGRLSVRELRTAWSRLLALEEPGATVVTKSVIQPVFSLRLTRVMDRGAPNQPVNFVANANTVPVPQKGPQWFRKMDRNGDGDVSRLEFLGTRAEFDAIDTDHDDLISLEEAIAWDIKVRGEKK
jgi:Ca2+-binding EF-hand superfamily protein